MSPNGLFVAVGKSDTNGNKIGTSPDGLNWTVAPGIGNLFGGVGGDGRDIAYGASTFVAVGFKSTPGNNINQIGTSPDGLNWTVAPGIGNLFGGGGGMVSPMVQASL